MRAWYLVYIARRRIYVQSGDKASRIESRIAAPPSGTSKTRRAGIAAAAPAAPTTTTPADEDEEGGHIELPSVRDQINLKASYFLPGILAHFYMYDGVVHPRVWPHNTAMFMHIYIVYGGTLRNDELLDIYRVSHE